MFTKRLLCALLLFASLDVASANIDIVDQQNAGAGFFLGATVALNQGFGQSFTPALPAINAADFSLISGGSSSTIRLDIFSGSGFGGSLIGSSNSITISGGSSQTYEFNFPMSIAIVPGNTYTFRLTLLSGSTYSPENSTDTYAGGTAFSPDGLPGSSVDLAFVEGLAIPEPSTAWLLLLALPFALARRFRRKLAPQL